jgi:hypothetical protein
VSVQHFQIACLEHVLRLRTVVPAAGQRPSHAIRVVSGELGPGINRSAYRRNRGLGNACECHGGDGCMTDEVSHAGCGSRPSVRFRLFVRTSRPAGSCRPAPYVLPFSSTRSAFRRSLPSRDGT